MPNICWMVRERERKKHLAEHRSSAGASFENISITQRFEWHLHPIFPCLPAGWSSLASSLTRHTCNTCRKPSQRVRMLPGGSGWFCVFSRNHCEHLRDVRARRPFNLCSGFVWTCCATQRKPSGPVNPVIWVRQQIGGQIPPAFSLISARFTKSDPSYSYENYRGGAAVKRGWG